MKFASKFGGSVFVYRWSQKIINVGQNYGVMSATSSHHLLMQVCRKKYK